MTHTRPNGILDACAPSSDLADPSNAGDPSPAVGTAILCGLLTVAATIVYGGYFFGTDDHLGILPMLRALTEPGRYAHDWYIQAERAMNVRLYYLWVLGAASAALGVPGASFALYVACGVFLYVGLTRLAGLFLRTPADCLIAAAIGFISPLAMSLGHARLVNPQMIPSLPAYALCTWALVAAVRGRPIRVGLLLGLTALFQGLIGLLGSVLVCAVVLFVHRGRILHRWRWWLAGAAVLALVALPNTLLVLSGENPGTAIGAEQDDFVTYAKLRIPWHVLPSTWPAAAWVSGALMLAFVMRSLVGPNAIRHRAYRILFALLLIGFCCGVVFVEVWPVAIMAKLQLFRGMVLFRVLLAAAVVSSLRNRLADDPPFATIATAVACAACLHDRLWLATGPILLLTTLTTGRRAGRIGTIATAATLAASLALMFGIERHETLVAAAVALALAGTLYAVARMDRPRLPRWSTSAATAGLVLAFVAVTPLPNGPLLPARLADRLSLQCNHSVPDDRPRNAGQRAAVWAAEHLPQDAVVLIAPYLKDFRYRSGRAVVVDFKAVPFTTLGLRQWRERLFDVCGVPPDADITGAGYPDLHPYFAAQSGEALARTAQRYGADYLAIEREVSGPWQLLHRDNAARLYARTD